MLRSRDYSKGRIPLRRTYGATMVPRNLVFSPKELCQGSTAFLLERRTAVPVYSRNRRKLIRCTAKEYADFKGKRFVVCHVSEPKLRVRFFVGEAVQLRT